MIYKFSAENISRPTALKLVRELEDKDVEVEHAEMDQVFDWQMTMIVTCDEAGAKKVQARIWELNAGLCCDMHIITPAELEAHY